MSTVMENLESGLAHHRAGNLEQAELLYRRVIRFDPQQADALHLLGITAHQRGEHELAADYIEKAIEINCEAAQFHSNLGAVYRSLSRLNESESSYREAVRLVPDYFEAHYNLGNVLHEQGRLEEAENCYLLAIELNQEFQDAQYNFGRLLAEQNRLEEAVECFRRTIEIAPSYKEAHNNLGLAFKHLQCLDEAIVCYQRALDLDANYTEAWNNLAAVQQDSGLLEEAAVSFDRAIQIRPDFSEAKFNRALLKLLQGNFQQGWEDYDRRWEHKNHSNKSSAPNWDGSSLTGKSIFVSAEQGLGDEVMFASCLSELISRCEQCVVECDSRLLSLFARSFPKAQFITRQHHDEPSELVKITDVDFQIPIGSLPRFLRNSFNDFPQTKQFLKTDEELCARWRERFDELGSGLKIGISWQGGAKPDIRRKKSTPLKNWSRLLTVPDVHFINLQHGDCDEELSEVCQSTGIKIHQLDNENLSDDLDHLAAQITMLDLVISVSNTTAHLAGAVGTPVWTLLPFIPDWRWFLDRNESPWYSNMRLFRQSQPGEWTAVFDRLEQQLAQFFL